MNTPELQMEVNRRFQQWKDGPQDVNRVRLNFHQEVCQEWLANASPEVMERIKYCTENRLVDVPEALTEAQDAGVLTQEQFDIAVANYRRQRCVFLLGLLALFLLNHRLTCLSIAR